MKQTWSEILQSEDLPSNVTLDFHCHNGGVRRVWLKGKQITFSKLSRKDAWSWIEENRVESFIVDVSRIDGYDWNRDVVVKVSFLNGEPSGCPAFGNRRERAATLRSVWGHRPHIYRGGI